MLVWIIEHLFMLMFIMANAVDDRLDDAEPCVCVGGF